MTNPKEEKRKKNMVKEIINIYLEMKYEKMKEFEE